MSRARQTKKILVALSGGVDSSAAALLLKKNGYDVTGAFMVEYDDGAECWLPDYHDAVRVAAKIGIPILKLDFRKEYEALVLNYMFAEYNSGRTPNPDVLCNREIKFGVWLGRARELGFDKLATGHYAAIKESAGKFELFIPKDKEKDQTYFLNQLSQEQLAGVLFPIGEYTKAQVREIARKAGLPTAEKKESMGICFVGEVPMKDFLMTRIKKRPGKIVMSSGEVIGEHDGLSFYTIGQRHIGGLSGGKHPMYVVAKKTDTDELVVGFEDDPLLYKTTIKLRSMHWISGHEPKFPLQCKARLRHRQALQTCTLSAGEAVLTTPQRAVAPGQFAVFYKNGECLGGGVIP